MSVINIFNALGSSIKEVGSLLHEVIGRDDVVISIENSNLLPNNEDKIKVSEAIDEMIVDEDKNETTVMLASGEQMTIMM